MERTRRLISVFLLTVFLSALTVSSVHRHPVHQEGPLCEACVHHLPHAGHIGAHDGGLSDCVLCHFLGLPFILALTAVLLPLLRLLRRVSAPVRTAPVSACLQTLRSRAPPAFLCAA